MTTDNPRFTTSPQDIEAEISQIAGWHFVKLFLKGLGVISLILLVPLYYAEFTYYRELVGVLVATTIVGGVGMFLIGSASESQIVTARRKRYARAIRRSQNRKKREVQSET